MDKFTRSVYVSREAWSRVKLHSGRSGESASSIIEALITENLSPGEYDEQRSESEVPHGNGGDPQEEL
jgi:hypothetical protein